MSGNPRPHRPVGPPRPKRAPVRRPETVLETSAGGLVVESLIDKPRGLLIARLDRRGRLIWSFPKGHVELGEGFEQTALREVQEETGVVAEVLESIGKIDFWFMAEGRRIHKTVHHFLMVARGGTLSDEDPEVDAVEWVPMADIRARLAYGDERDLLDKGRSRLADRIS